MICRPQVENYLSGNSSCAARYPNSLSTNSSPSDGPTKKRVRLRSQFGAPNGYLPSYSVGSATTTNVRSSPQSTRTTAIFSRADSSFASPTPAHSAFLPRPPSVFRVQSSRQQRGRQPRRWLLLLRRMRRLFRAFARRTRRRSKPSLSRLSIEGDSRNFSTAAAAAGAAVSAAHASLHRPPHAAVAFETRILARGNRISSSVDISR